MSFAAHAGNITAHGGLMTGLGYPMVLIGGHYDS